MYRIIVFILLALGFFSASGQSYYKDITKHKVTINQAEQTLLFFTEPVKQDVIAHQNKVYTWYSANQVNYTQGGFSGRLLNGPYSAYYLNKNLKEKGNFKKGLPDGEWRKWHVNGKLKEAAHWRQGLKTGRFTAYHEDGTVSQYGKYKKGLLNGRVITSEGKDSVVLSRYKNGVPTIKKEKKAHIKLKQAKDFLKKTIIPKKAKDTPAP